MTPGVVGVAEESRNDGQDVHPDGGRQQSPKPIGIRCGPVVFLPRFGPVVSKVHDQNQLDQNEEEAANHAKVHPDRTKGAVGDEERSYNPRQEQEELQTPKSVLDGGPGVPGAPDAHHHNGQDEKEESDGKADAVDGQIADEIRAWWQLLDLQVQLLRHHLRDVAD